METLRFGRRFAPSSSKSRVRSRRCDTGELMQSGVVKRRSAGGCACSGADPGVDRGVTFTSNARFRDETAAMRNTSPCASWAALPPTLPRSVGDTWQHD